MPRALAPYALRFRPSNEVSRMSDINSAWREQQRRRFMRTNAHLSIRHDAYRFLPPGSPRYVGKDVVRYFWPDSAGDQPQQAGEPEADWRDDPEVKRLVAEIRLDLQRWLI